VRGQHAQRFEKILRQVGGCTVSQASDVELKQSSFKLEGLRDIVSRSFVALVNSGVAPFNVLTHV
jgi:hypothetical protein